LLFRSRWWRLTQIFLSAGLIAWVLSGLGTDALLEVRRLSPGRLVLALVLFSLSQVFGGVRLWLLLRRQGSTIGCSTVMRLTWIGLFASNFLPSTIGGDVAKGALLIRSGLRGKVTIAALVMDRLVNMATMVGLTVGCVVAGRLGMLLIGGHAGVPPEGLGFAILFPWPLARLRRTGRSIGTTYLRGLVREYVGIARQWLNWPTGLALAVLLSGASVMSAVLGQFLLLRDLGIALELLEFTAISGLVYLITLVPVSLNGIGVREAGLVFLLVALGADRDAATVLAVLARLLMVATSIPGGFAMISLSTE